MSKALAKAVAKGVAGKGASNEAARGRRGDELLTAMAMSWSECCERFPPSVLCPFVVMDFRLSALPLSLSPQGTQCVCFLFICYDFSARERKK